MSRDVLWITRVMRSKEHVRPAPAPLIKTIIQETTPRPGDAEMETGGNMSRDSESAIMGSPDT